MASRSNNSNTLFDILGKDGSSPAPRIETASPATVVGIVMVLGLLAVVGGAWWFTRNDTPTNPPPLNNRANEAPVVAPAVYAVEVTTRAWRNEADRKDIEADVKKLLGALLERTDFARSDPRAVPDLERRLYRVLVGRAPTRADPELVKLEERVKKFVWNGRRAFEETARRIETGEK